MFGTMKGRPMLAGALLAVAGVLAACGGGGGGGSGATGGSAGSIALMAGSMQSVGGADGVGISAQLNRPQGVAMDAEGNVFVADSYNHTVRKITPDGEVTTVAGKAGESGSADGPVSLARFFMPYGVGVDRSGTLYVADYGNHAVRKIATNGMVTTVAGKAGQPGNVDGSSDASRMLEPKRVAVDPTSGTVYVAANGSLRKLATNGTLSTVARPSCGAAAAVTVDPAGNVYVAEKVDFVSSGASGCIRKFNNQGVAMAFSGAVAGSMQVPHPSDVALDRQGNLYVASSGTDLTSGGPYISFASILKVAPEGTVTTLAGAVNDLRVVDGPVSQARLMGPSGLAVHSDGRLVFSEPMGAVVRQIDVRNVVSTLAGGMGAGATDGSGSTARFFDPKGMAVAPDGTLYVADSRNRKVRRISAAGVVSTLSFIFADGSLGEFDADIQGLAVDGQGTVYVSEGAGQRILAIASTGRARIAGTSGSLYSALAAGASAKVYATGSFYINVMDANGTKQTAASGFTEPAALALGPDGRLYVADRGNHVVYVVDAQGAIKVVAGQLLASGYVDGPALHAKLDRPTALAFDAAGNLYIGDTTTIRKLTPQGVLSTVAGAPGQTTVAAGALPGAIGSVKALAWSSGTLFATVQNAVVKIGPLN